MQCAIKAGPRWVVVKLRAAPGPQSDVVVDLRGSNSPIRCCRWKVAKERMARLRRCIVSGVFSRCQTRELTVYTSQLWCRVLRVIGCRVDSIRQMRACHEGVLL